MLNNSRNFLTLLAIIFFFSVADINASEIIQKPYESVETLEAGAGSSPEVQQDSSFRSLKEGPSLLNHINNTATEEQKPKESVSTLSFNIIQYVVGKFKIQDYL